MAGIEQFLDFFIPVSFLAFFDGFFQASQIVDDVVRVRELLEHMVVLEERIMPVAGVRDDQHLHGLGVLRHAIGDGGVGVDDGKEKKVLSYTCIEYVSGSEEKIFCNKNSEVGL